MTETIITSQVVLLLDRVHRLCTDSVSATTGAEAVVVAATAESSRHRRCRHRCCSRCCRCHRHRYLRHRNMFIAWMRRTCRLPVPSPFANFDRLSNPAWLASPYCCSLARCVKSVHRLILGAPLQHLSWELAKSPRFKWNPTPCVSGTIRVYSVKSESAKVIFRESKGSLTFGGFFLGLLLLFLSQQSMSFACTASAATLSPGYRIRSRAVKQPTIRAMANIRAEGGREGQAKEVTTPMSSPHNNKTPTAPDTPLQVP